MPRIALEAGMSAAAIKGGMIGENIGRSRFARAFQLFCDRDGRKLEFTPFDTKTMPGFNFDGHVARLPANGFTAVTVTHPFKTFADAVATRRDGYPDSLGAANLLRFDNGALTAFNTDYTGMIAAWRAVFGDAKPGRVAMAGAGGVARAVGAALIELGADSLDIWDLRSGAAEALCDQLDPERKVLRPVDVADSIASVQQAAGVVNCTPLGTTEYPGSAFVEESLFGREWAFDAVYAPIETEFMQAAKAAGLARMSGFDLFKHMAVRSYAAYTNTNVNSADADLLDHLSEGL